MPGLLPIILVGTHLMLVADKVPQLDVGPSCRAAATAAVTVDRSEGSCKRDEDQARAKLEQEWGQFTPPERSQCVQLSTLGGPPSYVELLTCLELSKAAASLPVDTAAVAPSR